MTDSAFAIPDGLAAMHSPVAFVGDRFVSLDDATVPIWDMGFLLGVTITERLRTLKRKVWLMDQHLDRMELGLALANVPLPFPRSTIVDIINNLAAHHQRLEQFDEELSISLCITAGDSEMLSPKGWGQTLESRRSRLVASVLPLPVKQFQRDYISGISACIAETREIPASSVDRRIKSRSRIHYWLAEQETARKDPTAKTILLDQSGNLAEGTTATVAIVDKEAGSIVLPPAEQRLPGITIEMLKPVFEHAKLVVVHRDISSDELASCREILWISSSPICLPVTTLDGRPVGHGKPGPVFQGVIDSFEAIHGVRLQAT
ncbi:MAG: aminotransferase class IV [Pirellulaceae bacterium]